MPTENYQSRMSPGLREAQNDHPSLTSRCCQFTEDSIRENPMAATMAAFGLGVGVGAVIGMMLAEPPARTRRQTAEMLGRRMLDSIAEALPESVRRHVA